MTSAERDHEADILSRRSLLTTMAVTGLGIAAQPLFAGEAKAMQGASTGLSQSGSAEEVAPMELPLRLNALMGHTGTSVEDVVASATFYARMIGGRSLSGEKLADGSVRYFMQLGRGSVAIGKLGTLGSVGQTKPLIDHICVGAETYDDAAWRARLKAEGLPYIAQSVFLDPDKIAIQVSGGQGGEGLAAGSLTRLPDLYTGQPLVQSIGFDHVILRVSDVHKAAAFWKRLFDIPEVGRTGDIIWITDGASKVGLRRVQAGERPGVDAQAIRVAQFDKARVSRELTALGAKVGRGQPYDTTNTIHFVGPDGIKAAIVSAV